MVGGGISRNWLNKTIDSKFVLMMRGSMSGGGTSQPYLAGYDVGLHFETICPSMKSDDV